MSPLRSLLLCGVLVLAFATVHVYGDDTSDDTTNGTDDFDDEDNSTDALFNNLTGGDSDADDGEEDTSERRKRSSYGYGQGSGYGNYGSYGSYGGYNAGYSGGLGGYGGGHGGGYGGYGNAGYGNAGYNNGGQVSYDRSYTKSPVLTFVKGFKPGKTYVEKGKVVRNYYRHGTYEVALQHYKFIPVIKVVPFTTYDTVGYTGHVQAHNDYTAVICKDCYHGYPKIDVYANRGGQRFATRRFVYLPESYHIDGLEGGRGYNH